MADDRVRGLYRRLLALYPRPFRERFGESMEQAFADLRRERSTGPGWFGPVVRAFVDTTVGILKEHGSAGHLRSLIRTPGAWLPIAISLTALVEVLVYAAWAEANGVVSSGDEGAPARIFQMLMLGQALVIVVFAARWLPRAPRPATMIIAIQLLVAAVPIVTLLFLESRAAGG